MPIHIGTEAQYVLYLRRLVAGFPLGQPGFKPRLGHMLPVVDKAALGQVSLSTSVSSAISHSVDCFTTNPGLVQQAK
jgi:hypothetical protein